MTVCHDRTMTEPTPPARTERVERDDGTMDLHLWLPEGADAGHPVPGLVLVHEIFGVGEYIADVAASLTAQGYAVGAPTVFWRFAPGWAASHDAKGMAASLQKAQQLDVPTAITDCAAALDALGAQPEVVGAPGVIGFCLGGTLAFGTAVQAAPSVCVSYYGSGVPGMLDRLDDVTCPTLFHFGARDDYIASDDVAAVATAIEERDGFVLNVEDAGHAFDNHRADMFYVQNASDAAWAKTLAFLNTHLPPGRSVEQ
jgi:carboxymethylenebutenolidase